MSANQSLKVRKDHFNYRFVSPAVTNKVLEPTNSRLRIAGKQHSTHGGRKDFFMLQNKSTSRPLEKIYVSFGSIVKVKLVYGKILKLKKNGNGSKF